MDVLLQAQQAFRNRDFDTAEKLLVQCLEQSPDDATILMRLGQVHMAQGNFEDSFVFLRRSQKQDPHHPAVYRSIGMAIRMSGLIDLGISYLGTMLTYAPLLLQPQVHLTLAELFAVKGDIISLKNSLLLLENIPPTDNPRMELRLWKEIIDTEGMKRMAQRYPSYSDLVYGLVNEQSQSSVAIEYLKRESCGKFWEADLGLYRMTGTFRHLQSAHKKAPKTAEVIVELATSQRDFETLQRLSKSPVIFDSVRQQALKALHDFRL